MTRGGYDDSSYPQVDTGLRPRRARRPATARPWLRQRAGKADCEQHTENRVLLRRLEVAVPARPAARPPRPPPPRRRRRGGPRRRRRQVCLRDSCRRLPSPRRDHDADPRARARLQSGARALGVAAPVFVPVETTMVEAAVHGRQTAADLHFLSQRQISVSSIFLSLCLCMPHPPSGLEWHRATRSAVGTTNRRTRVTKGIL